MIEITFYTNYSENNRLNKLIENVYTLNGILKDDTSVTRPIITIEKPVNSIVVANYAFIPSFSRYYFIDDIVSISDGLSDVYLHVDVLMSFKDYIRNQGGIVKRQENDWNLYLNDGSFKVYQNKTVETYQFPNAFPADNDLVLAVAGRVNIN